MKIPATAKVITIVNGQNKLNELAQLIKEGSKTTRPKAVKQKNKISS